jgi:hypothetical protein
MRQLKPTKQNKSTQRNTDKAKPAAQANNIRPNAAHESSVNDQSPEPRAEHTITNQAEQNKITNAENDGPLDEKENEGV